MKKLLYILLLFPLIVQGQRIHITTVTDTVCNGSPAYFTATDTGVSASYYQWTINRVNIAGANTASFSRSALSTGDSIACLLTNRAHDTIIAHSNSITVTVLSISSAGIINGSDSIVCVGATITLDDAVTGGVWSASDNFATVSGGVVTGVFSFPTGDGAPLPEDSIYYIVNNTYCSDTAYKIITVEAIPRPAFYLGYPYSYASSLCVGETLSINGGDGADGIMYSTTGDVLVSIWDVYGERAGTDYIFCVGSNSCGSDTVRSTITVYGPPTAPGAINASSTTLCVGSTIILSDTASNPSEWRSSNSNASVNFNGIVTGNIPGLDTIFYITSNQCGSASASIPITINGPQPIIGIDSFCKGEQIKFSDHTNGGTWSSSNPTVAAIDQNGTLKGISEGHVMISYTVPSSDCSAVSEIDVHINNLPSPITGIADFCLSGTTYLTDLTSGGVWTSSNTAVARINNVGEVQGVSSGSATITYSLKGCLETVDVSVAACGNEMSIYPNPAHDEVTIYAFDNIYNAYSFFNALGQIVLHGPLAGPFTKVNLELVAAGFYTIVITGEQDRYVGKFVKD